jgi:ArsR family transcriptional regulator
MVSLVFISVNAYVLKMPELAHFFAALADPTRLRLLNLMQDEICVCHLQSVLETNQPKISRHLAYLRKVGLVNARRDGKWMHYSLKTQTSGLQKILLDTLAEMRKHPSCKTDIKRLKNICRCPSQFGVSSISKC